VGRSVVVDGEDVPVFQTQKVSSQVELAVGQSLVLGGVRSTRTKRVKGLLSSRDEVETGTLYVCLATYEDAPRARAVEPDWVPDSPGVLPPVEWEK
jgi:hypothetical protein